MSISSYTVVTMLDSRPSPITISMPKTSDIANRIITFKDLYGSASNSTITLVTRSGDTFEDGTFSTILSNAYQTVNLYAGQPGKWLNIDGGSGGGLTTISNLLNAVSTNVTSVSTNVATVSNLLNSVSTNATSVSTNLATVSNTGRFAYVSTNTISTNQLNSSNICNVGWFSNAGNLSNGGSAYFFSNGVSVASPSTTNAYPYASFTINNASTNTTTPVSPLLLTISGYGGSIAGGLTQNVGAMLTLGTFQIGVGNTVEGYRLTGSNSAFYGNMDMQENNISNINITRTTAVSTNTISTNSITAGANLDLTATSINLHTSSIQQYLNYVPVPQPVIQFGYWSGPAAGSDGLWGGGPETITITDYNNTNYCIYITGKNINSGVSPSFTAVPINGYSFYVYIGGGEQTYSNVFYWQTMGNYGASAGPVQGN